MIAVVQRVLSANVVVDGSVVGEIGRGLLVLAAVHKEDSVEDATWMAGKLHSIRLFPDADKGFHLDVKQIAGAILLVSNFTVAADTRNGRRPSLIAAADPVKGRELFDAMVEAVRAAGVLTATGIFGADMRVSLVNDGPVTVLFDSRNRKMTVFAAMR